MNFFRSILLLLALGAGAAQAFTLSGTVTGGATPLADATVTLFDATTSGQLAQATTSASGQYGFSVGAGTYNLQVAPPSGSIYSGANVNGIVVTDADVEQNIALVSGLRTVSGTMTGHSGEPLPGSSISLRACANAGLSLAGAVTDALGHYSLQIGDGQYCAWLNVGGAPEMVQALELRAQGPFTVSGNTVKDYAFPIARISGKILGSGNPVAGVNVRIPPVNVGNWTEPATGIYYQQIVYNDAGLTVSAANGDYAFKVMPGSYGLRLDPPAGSPFYSTSVNLGVSTDQVVDLALSVPRTLSGRMTGHQGEPLQGAGISLRACASAGQPLVNATTDASGDYTVQVGDGEYCAWLYVGGAPEMAQSIELRAQGPFTVSGNTVKDYAFPIARISGKVMGNGTPVAGVNVRIPPVNFGNWTEPATGIDYQQIVYNDAGLTISAANGDYAFKVMPGSYGLRLDPPAGSPFYSTSVNLGVSTDQVVDLALSAPRTLSGRMTGHQGEPLQGASISLRACASAGQPLVNAATDADGNYTMQVGDGEYCAWLGIGGGTAPGMATHIELRAQGPFTVSGNTVKDYAFPIRRISGKATDANGVPISGVTVRIPPFHFANWTEPESGIYYQQNTYNDFTVLGSDLDGNYQLKVMPGTYGFQVSGPSGSGFANTTLNYPVSGDSQLQLVLPFPDNVDPRVLSGPDARDVTESGAVIEWLTNEPTSGEVLVNASSFPEPGPPRTAHSVRVTGLSPSTAYLATIASSDAAGNGPVVRDVSFTTRDGPDTLAPVFIDGPVVTGVTHEGAVVEWATNEPASGGVEFGTTPTLGSVAPIATAATRHRVAITGLAAGADHFAQVAVTDASGNGPARSALIAFRTLAAPDLVPPAIVGRAVALDVTSSAATITWTTDKPATSGVSWNDGVAHGLVSDPAFRTQHTMRIVGLVPGTSYTVTAASKDERNNGPALSTITFSTLPAGDVLPPVISCGPYADDVRRQSANIRWCTGEASDSRVRFGLSAANLDRVESLSRLETQHRVVLTRLAQSTTYYYRVESRDVAGNASAVGPTLSFTTPASPGSIAFAPAPSVVYQSDRQITVAWGTTVPADATLDCTPAAGGETRRATRAERQTTHQLTLANLQPNVAYTCRVKSIDIEGNAVEQ